MEDVKPKEQTKSGIPEKGAGQPAEQEVRQDTGQEAMKDAKQEPEKDTEKDAKQESKKDIEKDAKQEPKKDTEKGTKQEPKKDTEKDAKQESKKDTKKEVKQAAPAGKKKKKKKILPVLIVLTLLASMLLLAYVGIAFYFKSHFLPGTHIDGADCSQLNAQEAQALLEQHSQKNYTLTLIGRGGQELLTLSAKDVGLQIDYKDAVAEALNGQAIFEWPAAVAGKVKQEQSLTLPGKYEEEKLKTVMTKAGMWNRAGKTVPENAYIGEYESTVGGYAIVPETEGTILDEDRTLDRIGEAIAGLEPLLELAEADCYEQADVIAEDKKLQAALNAMNKLVSAKISYDWNGVGFVLDKDTINTWILEADGRVTLDTEQIAGFVAQMAKQYDTYGKNRQFTTVQGVELTLRSGAYGWKTDKEAETEELTALIEEGAVMDREPVFVSQGYVKGQNDVGDSFVEIDLTNQHLYLWIEGQNVLETDFVSGDAANGHNTPSGVFGITYKTTDAVLRGPDYETPVKYWMPFNGDVGMHDATWRRSFGGEIYLTNGSHGCINMPLSKAKEIYGYMKKGFPVVCYYY